MTEFDVLYPRWRGMPFPPGSPDDAVDELHADLALVDVWIAETVVPFVERAVLTPPQVDIAAEIVRLRDRAVTLRESTSGDAQQRVESYIEYLDLVDKLFAAFRFEHSDLLI